jgi:uncharacterized protein with PIN domain
VAAYVDTSAFVGILFAEAKAHALPRALARHDEILSGSLLVPELLATLKREARPLSDIETILPMVSLVLPDRSLREECEEALAHGYLRGADLWHVATAMALAGRRRRDLMFVSLDQAQRAVAAKVGFQTLPG